MSREEVYQAQPQMRGQRPIGQFLPNADPPFLMFFYGQKIGWMQKHVLHAFAHVVVHFLHGDDVEPHGPEFVGVLCHLMSETLDVPKRSLHLTAEALGVEVAPFVGTQRPRQPAKPSNKKTGKRMTNRRRKSA